MTEQIQLPETAPPQWDSIPSSLAGRQQWLLWKFESKEGQKKPGKIPYYVGGGRRTGGQGEDRDRQRLATLAVARSAFERGGWSGVGFAFLPGDGLIGIDLDGQLDGESGEWSERCRNIVAACDSFTEISPSGKGVHIIVEGETRTNKCNDIGVEVFTGRQFFTVTADRFPNTPPDVRAVDEQTLRRLHKTIDDAKAARVAKQPPPASAPSRAAPRPTTSSGGADDFRRVNDAAMAMFQAWVPTLFPSATPRGNGYRVTSKALGRDLQEDLSIAPEGIVDFGVADMGDARQGSRTPIDLVMEWLPATKPVDALKWLAPLVGVELTVRPAAPEKKREESASAGGRSGAGGSGAPPGDPPDDDDEGAAGEPGDVYSLLVTARGKPLDCRENVLYCLLHDQTLAGLVRKNEFTKLIERSRETPWGRPAGEWDEEDDLMLGEFLLRTYRLGIKGKGTLRDGVQMAARQCKYNPVIDRIKRVRWDGVDRIDFWLPDVFEVEDRPYTRLIGRCFFMGLVQRAVRPGCKFDYMLILKGDQGLQKSGAFRTIGYPWFTDNAIKVGDKDSMMAQQLAWLVESAELESLNKSETTAIKQHLSAQEDWFRPPYGSQLVRSPRHSVHVGTTNADTFLKDATGDRRMWPLEVHQVNLEVLSGMLDQLLAEALHRIEAGERYWPTREEERDIVFPEQEPFKRADTWEDILDAYLSATAPDKNDDPNDPVRAKRAFFTTIELYRALDIKADRIDGAGQMDTRIGNAMRNLGFQRHRETSGRRRRGFRRLPPAAPLAAAQEALADTPPPREEDEDLPF